MGPEQLMACRQAFILENNFENASREGLTRILDRHDYQAVTVLMRRLLAVSSDLRQRFT